MFNVQSSIVLQGNKVVQKSGRKHMTTASASGSSVIASTIANTGLSTDLLLTDILPNNESSLKKFYRDIYEYDAIGGSYVDLVSTLPFSEFNLYGGEQEQLDVFEDAVRRLNVAQLLPEICVSYNVEGTFVGSLVYDEKEKNFMDIIPYDTSMIKFTDVPFYNLDPIIQVNNDERVRNFLENNSPAIEQYKKKMPKDLLNALRSESYELDPLITLYIPRRNDIRTSLGTSVFKRLLPVYLLEKMLFRGTLVEASKRQRALLHAKAGDETWDPTPDELNEVVAIFQQAEMDPLGAIVATRQGIDLQEMRGGGEFWKITDIYDTTSQMKLRALGISENFLSGEASYNAAEINMTVFIEGLKHLRNTIEYKMFTNKIFPMISALHGFKKESNKDKAKDNLKDVQTNELSNLFIPKVHWNKNLEPADNKDLMDVLDKLTEKQIPVPVRMMLAAGGINPTAFLNELEEDIRYQQRLSAVKDKMVRLDTTGDGIADKEVAISSLFSQRIGIGSRYNQLQDNYEIIGTTRTGKPKYIPNQVEAHKKSNEVIAKAYSNLTDKNVYNSTLKRLKKSGVTI